jgi:hypothetical protein
MRRIFASVSAIVLPFGLATGGQPAFAGVTTSIVTSTDQMATSFISLDPTQGADVYGVGGGKADFGLQSFDISAHTGPQGDFGHVAVTEYAPTGALIVSVRVDVTCVHIHGPIGGTFDAGVIRGNVSSVTPVPNGALILPGATLIFLIKDGGNLSSGPVDDFYSPNADTVPAMSCKDLFYLGSLDNVTQGNINIDLG